MPNIPGQNWILLRGLARESAHWGDFVSLLQTAFPEAQITLLDLPGTGGFYQEISPNNIPEITAKVRQQALDQGLLKQPVTILALSLGGMVAWEWMQKYPNDINGATLINTSFANLSPFYHRLRWQSYREFFSVLTTCDVYRKESKIVQLVSNRRDQVQKIVKEWADIQSLRPISLHNKVRQLLAAARFRPDDKKPGQPILLLNGQGDRLVSGNCSEAIHKKWQLELRRHSWAGHDLPLDDGAWVVVQLKDWIERLNTQE
jgi:pimeloyl-ACP methyl ester carboxylesterase